MSCKFKDKLPAYLEEQLSPQEMQALENHVDDCAICQRELDKLTEDSLQLSSFPLEVDDEVLISRIKARRQGLRRMTIYGSVGFILGLFSRFYTSDHFIVTKAIMALPYKLAEFLLTTLFGSHQLAQFQPLTYHNPRFFPYQPILNFLAELLTPAIIATFIAIMIAYLVSDKRVFRRKNIIRFLITGILTLGLWLGTLYGVNAFTTAQISHLSAVKSVAVYRIQLRAGQLKSANLVSQQLLGPELEGQLVQTLKQSKKLPGLTPLPQTSHLRLDLVFPGGGKVAGYVDANSPTLVLVNGTRYQVPAEFIQHLDTLTEVK